jgi:hypothetical protein
LVLAIEMPHYVGLLLTNPMKPKTIKYKATKYFKNRGISKINIPITRASNGSMEKFIQSVLKIQLVVRISTR